MRPLPHQRRRYRYKRLPMRMGQDSSRSLRQNGAPTVTQYLLLRNRRPSPRAAHFPPVKVAPSGLTSAVAITPASSVALGPPSAQGPGLVKVTPASAVSITSFAKIFASQIRVVPLTATAAITVTAATAARGQVHTTTTTTAAWINASATQPTWRRHDDCHDDHRWCGDSTTMARRRRDGATTAKTTARVGRATTAQRLRNDGASRSRNDRTATAQQRHESAVRRRRDEHHDRDYDRDHGHEAAGDEAAAEGRAVGGDGNGDGAAGMAMVPREW
ncbi:hypothetical protein EDB85DRAFT_2280332 [Lactarius pseudohatsudake]|nr:hypothetical protein EDB85DRAFT_2280332 [Lactarius pseudohatsudake]